MKFLLSAFLLLTLCGAAFGGASPGWPPPSYVIAHQWQNVKDYGAKGDGTTDDRAAIQAALDAVGDSGGTVFVPHSDSGFLIKNTLRQPSYVRLLGVGWGSRIQMHPDSSRCILANADTLNGDTGIVVENVYFDGAKSYSLFSDRDSADCISFINVHRSSVQGCFVTRSDADGIAFRRSTDCKILNNTLWELGEDGITVAGLGSGSNIVSGNHVAGRDTSYEVGGLIPSGILCKSSEVVISSNIITEGGAAIDINNESGDTLRDITITGNLFLNCWQTTVSIADGVRIVVTENSFYDCASEGVYTWATAPVSHDINISNNTFYSQGAIAIRAASGDNYVISGNVIVASDTSAIVVSGDNVTVSANRVDTVTTGRGIHLESCRHSSVEGNVVSNVGGYGIYLEGGATGGEYMTVTGNTVTNCDKDGIKAISTDFSTISFNVCVDNDSAGIALSGSYNNNLLGNICTNRSGSQQFGLSMSASTKNYVANNQFGGNADASIEGYASNHIYANAEDTVGASTAIDFLGRIALTNIDNTARIVVTGVSADLQLNATAGGPFVDFQLDTVTIWSLQTDSTSQNFNFRAGAVNRLSIATNGAVTFNEAITFPTSDSTAGYVWATNGAGEMVWVPNDTGAGAGGEANTISDTGTYNDTEGFGLAGGKIGVALKVKGLIEGSNITIAKSGDSGLIITGAAGSGTVDSFYVIFTDSASAANGNRHVSGFLTPGDTLYVDTTDNTGGASADSTLVLMFHSGTYPLIKWLNDSTFIAIDSTHYDTLVFMDSAGTWLIDGYPMGSYQPLEATLTDIADGTIEENLVNTANPWADNEVTDALTVTGYMQDEDINTFTELQSWVSDKTLLNEEDAFTIDAGWTFAGLLAVDSTNTAHLVSGNVYLGNDTLKGIDVLVVDTVVVDGDVIKDFTGTNLTVTAGVLNAAGGGGTADSTYINDGTQYGPFTNDMYKIKEGTGINIVREDSTTYDVFKFNISESDPIWTSDSADYAMKTWIGPFIDTTTLDTIENAHHAVSADSAGKALQDASGNVITSTYATPSMFGPFIDTTTLDTIQNAHKAVLSDDADTSGTKLSAALANRLDDLLSDVYKYFDRTYFDTAADAGGDSIICIYSDSTDLGIFDTDDLAEGSNKYDKALPDSGEWGIAYDSSQQLDALRAEMDDSVTATNVNAAGAVMETDFAATSFLYALTDNIPLPKTPAEVRAILSVEDGATADQTPTEILNVLRDSISGDGTVGAGGVFTIEPNAVESTMLGADQVNDLDINFGTGTDQVSPFDFVDEDVGDMSISNGSWTLDNDVVASAEMADADHGDFTYSSGTATLDADVVGDNEIDYSAVTFADFDYQTAWRSFYSNAAGDVTELAFGTNGKVLTSGGASSAPTWEMPTTLSWDTIATKDTVVLVGAAAADTTLRIYRTIGGVDTTTMTPETGVLVLGLEGTTRIDSLTVDLIKDADNVTMDTLEVTASFEFPSGTNPTVDVEGKAAWETDDDCLRVRVGDSNAAITPKKFFSATLALPKNLYDSLAVWTILPIRGAPFGIYIESLWIETDNSSSYSVIFEEWSVPQTKANDIDTIATSTSYKAAGVPSDRLIASTGRIKVRLPATAGTKELIVGGTYWIRTGD